MDTLILFAVLLWIAAVLDCLFRAPRGSTQTTETQRCKPHKWLYAWLIYRMIK